MELEEPIFLTVVTTAEAVASISCGTEPITALLLGDWKIAIPRPNRTTPTPTPRYDGPGPSLLRKRSAVKSTAMPKAERNLDPILSDILPLMGETIMIGTARIAIKRPTRAPEYPSDPDR